ncbi:MAG: GNAT family N-acetyltransferase [Leptolyngbya sp. PLA3]|nr:MAG: GNAT family N-acetyltransferase [Cyanobacteria bacterium CYA]MCE7968738.1 GNAT family N-acetyltransferase [Leptolyngbya sp. PL-A3]
MIMLTNAAPFHDFGDKAFAVNASPIHAAAICRLVAFWADRGLTIRRGLREVITNIDDFVVAMHRQRAVGCGALEAVSGEVGEIRSIAVAEHAARVGAGRAVVDALVAKAHARGMSEVVLLTKTPEFFGRLGFEAIGHEQLPAVFTGMIAQQPGRTLTGKVAMRRVLAPAPAAEVVVPAAVTARV